MTKAIVTVLYGTKSVFIDHGLPWVALYAKSHNYDLAIIGDTDLLTVSPNGELKYEKLDQDFLNKVNSLCPHYRKYYIYHLLDRYDRVCHLDLDMAIRPGCDDLFDVVDENKIGVVVPHRTDLNAMWTKHTHNKAFNAANARYKNVPFNKFLQFNSGVMVCSKMHKEMFNFNLGTMEYFFEQTQLNYNVCKLGLEIQSLPLKYNYINKDKKTEFVNSEFNVIHFIGADKRLLKECSINFANHYDVSLELPHLSKSELKKVGDNTHKKVVRVQTDKPFIFCSVPKNASSSIKTALGIQTVHIPLKKIRANERKQFSQSLKIAFTRNPYDRFLSIYLYRKSLSPSHPYYKADANECKIISEYESFGEFCHRFIDYPNKNHPHFKTQTYYICDDNGSCLADFIGRYETLEKSWNDLKAELNTNSKIELPRQNASIPHVWQDYYTDEIKRFVYFLYKKDFENFGYDPEL